MMNINKMSRREHKKKKEDYVYGSNEIEEGSRLTDGKRRHTFATGTALAKKKSRSFVSNHGDK